jgi:hypothetical protein
VAGDEILVAAVELAGDGPPALLELANRLGATLLQLGVAGLQGIGDPPA